MILAGLVISLFLTTPMTEFKQDDQYQQTATQAIKEAFSNKAAKDFPEKQEEAVTNTQISDLRDKGFLVVNIFGTSPFLKVSCINTLFSISESFEPKNL